MVLIQPFWWVEAWHEWLELEFFNQNIGKSMWLLQFRLRRSPTRKTRPFWVNVRSLWRNSLGCGRVVWSGQAWHKFGFQPGSILSWDDTRGRFRHKARFADKSPSQGFIWPIQQTASISTTEPGASTWCFGGVAHVFNLGCWACLRAAACVKTRYFFSVSICVFFIWFSVSAHITYMSVYHVSRFFHPLQSAKKPWLTPVTPVTPMTFPSTRCQLRVLLAAICLICYCAPTYRKAFRRLGTAPGSTLCWVFIGI